MEKDPADIRREYNAPLLDRSTLLSDPLQQFGAWLDEAIRLELLDATAMVLSTANLQGHVSARIVLLKSFDETGFVFFSDYGSRKGADIEENRQVSLLFHWRELERQVRISGSAVPISREESRLYFQSRPHLSQLSAVISEQSKEVASRQVLEARLGEYSDVELDMPHRWGGYRVTACDYEFWQGRPSRLHDRFHYSLEADDSDDWRIVRLQP